MYQHSRLITNRFSLFQKFKNLDYILLFCILLLGSISLATMYSTDGGEVLFHTKSQICKQIFLPHFDTSHLGTSAPAAK